LVHCVKKNLATLSPAAAKSPMPLQRNQKVKQKALENDKIFKRGADLIEFLLPNYKRVSDKMADLWNLPLR
jgi:hypothetical protein